MHQREALVCKSRQHGAQRGKGVTVQCTATDQSASDIKAYVLRTPVRGCRREQAALGQRWREPAIGEPEHMACFKQIDGAIAQAQCIALVPADHWRPLIVRGIGHARGACVTWLDI